MDVRLHWLGLAEIPVIVDVRIDHVDVNKSRTKYKGNISGEYGWGCQTKRHSLAEQGIPVSTSAPAITVAR